MKLYDIPMGSKLRIQTADDQQWHDGTFHHIDGMYSYCTLDDGPDYHGESHVFHLSASTPMKTVKDHYEIDIADDLAND